MARWTKAQLALFEERRAKMLDLSLRGRNYEMICRISQEERWEPQPYFSVQAVGEDMKVALRSRRERREELAAEKIEVEMLKLDKMEEIAWDVLESLHYVVNQGEVVYVYPEEQPEFKKQGWARPKLRDPGVVDALAREKEKTQAQREPLVDNKPKLDALTVLLKIAERRSKLGGYDAPVKKQIEVSSGENVDDRVSRVLAELENLARAGQGALAPGSVTTPGSAQIPDTGGTGTQD